MDADEADGRPGVVPAHTVVLAVVAAVAYGTFLLGNWLSPELDVVNGYVSELSAVDQPFHLVYGGGDAVTGALTIIVALRALRSLQRRPLATAGWSFLGMFGFFAIGDAAFPLDCAPSLETWCALRERSENVSFSHEFHSVTSSAVIFCGVVALFTLSMAARRYGWWPVLARYGPALALAETVLALSTLLAMFLGRWLGIIQRVQIGVLCLGVLTIAWALHGDRSAVAAGARPTSPQREKSPL